MEFVPSQDKLHQEATEGSADPRTRRYTSTLHIHPTTHRLDFKPMNGGGRSIFQPPRVPVTSRQLVEVVRRKRTGPETGQEKRD